MIEAHADLAGLLVRLRQRAAQLGKSRAVAAASTHDPRRWRTASLLWPLIGME